MRLSGIDDSISKIVSEWGLSGKYEFILQIYKHVRRQYKNLGQQFIISKILICPLLERIKKVQTVFSQRCEKRFFASEIVQQPMILDCQHFVQSVFVLRPFFTNKATHKDWLFRNPKRTPYSRHCIFKRKKWIDSKKARELSQISSYRTLKTDKN